MSGINLGAGAAARLLASNLLRTWLARSLANASTCSLPAFSVTSQHPKECISIPDGTTASLGRGLAIKLGINAEIIAIIAKETAVCCPVLKSRLRIKNDSCVTNLIACAV